MDPGSSPVWAGAADIVRRVDCLRAVLACTEAMKRRQQLHPSRAPSEPQSGFLGRRRRREAAVGALPGAVLAQVVDVLAVRRAACRQVGRQVSQFLRRRWSRQPSPTVAIVENSISFEQFFDKVADTCCCGTLTRW